MLVCENHGSTRIMREEGVTVAIALRNVLSTYKDSLFVDDLLLGVFFNCGDDDEWGLDISNGDFTVLWHRCDATRVNATNGENVMEDAGFHGGESLYKWTVREVINRMTRD